MDAGEENHWGIKVMTYSNNNSNWGERGSCFCYHMSMGVEYSVEPSRTSGGRYHSVTTSFE